MKGILGRKLGMSQVFATDGTLIPVTVIEVEPNVVMQVKSKETDGYVAIQLGYEDKKEKHTNKAQLGQAKKAGVSPKKFIKEIRSDEMNYEVGQLVKADIFSAGDMVDVSGISKGKGYTGVIARYNQHMVRESHGSGPVHRSVGSLATTGRNNGRIEKNTRMPGQDGAFNRTSLNLQVVKVDSEKNYILVKGNVPGAKRGFVVIRTTVKPVKHVNSKELVNYTLKEGE